MMPTGNPQTPTGPGTPGTAGVGMVGQMPPGSMPPMPMQQQQQQPDFNVIQYDGLKDPIIKSKELFVQLKQSLHQLLNQLSQILNPANPDLTKQQTENQFQMLGKYVETFNRVCDLLIANLRTACESQQVSNDLKQFIRFIATSTLLDPNRTGESTLSTSFNLQMQRINELRSLFQRYLEPPTQPMGDAIIS